MLTKLNKLINESLALRFVDAAKVLPWGGEGRVLGVDLRGVSPQKGVGKRFFILRFLWFRGNHGDAEIPQFGGVREFCGGEC